MKKATGQLWLAKRLGISQPRVSKLVAEGRIPRKTTYTTTDVDRAAAVLRDARATANASQSSDSGENDAAIRSISKNPERIAKIKLIIKRTAKIEAETALLTGQYLKREQVEQERIARVFAVRAKMQEIPHRAALLVGKLEAEIEHTLTAWMREICEHFAGGAQ